MSRRYDRPLRCTSNDDGVPTAFWWRRQHFRVRNILDSWREIGEWWHGEQESVWFRVETSAGGVFELYQNIVTKEWRLWKVID